MEGFRLRAVARPKVGSRAAKFCEQPLTCTTGDSRVARPARSSEQSAVRPDGQSRTRWRGKRARELAARADAELGEDLSQMVCNSGRADEQLPGDLRFLCGKDVWRLGGTSGSVPAACSQFDTRPFGERSGADRGEDVVCAAQLVTTVTYAPLAAQPLAIQQMSAPELHGQASAAKAADGLPVKGLSILAFAHKRSRAGFDAQRPVAPAGAGNLR